MSLKDGHLHWIGKSLLLIHTRRLYGPLPRNRAYLLAQLWTGHSWLATHAKLQNSSRCRPQSPRAPLEITPSRCVCSAGRRIATCGPISDNLAGQRLSSRDHSRELLLPPSRSFTTCLSQSTWWTVLVSYKPHLHLSPRRLCRSTRVSLVPWLWIR